MIKNQRGVTLIELMIGMVLGLSLVAGIGSLFVQSQKSFRLQQNLSDMTDDASFILESLAKGLLLAGFADNRFCTLDSSTFTANDNVMSTSGLSNISFENCEFIKGLDTGVGSGKNSQLAYRFQLGIQIGLSKSSVENFVGTSGLPNNTGDIVTVRIYKKNDTDGIPVLYSKAESTSETGNNAESLISQVQQLVFLYGVKITNTANCTIYTPCFYFADAPTITTNNDWLNIYAVKVFLVMRSADDNVVHIQKGYEIDGVQQTSFPSDKRLYKTFTKTIYLRTNDK